jgi:hypothetical protein
MSRPVMTPLGKTICVCGGGRVRAGAGAPAATAAVASARRPPAGCLPPRPPPAARRPPLPPAARARTQSRPLPPAQRGPGALRQPQREDDFGEQRLEAKLHARHQQRGCRGGGGEGRGRAVRQVRGSVASALLATPASALPLQRRRSAAVPLHRRRRPPPRRPRPPPTWECALVGQALVAADDHFVEHPQRRAEHVPWRGGRRETRSREGLRDGAGRCRAAKVGQRGRAGRFLRARPPPRPARPLTAPPRPAARPRPIPIATSNP